VADRAAAYVLDSFAVLAYLEAEAGMPRVQTLLTGAAAGGYALYLSLMNLGEVLYITERERGLVQAQQTVAVLDQLPLQVVPVSRATVLAAAHVKARFAVAFADAFAVVAAQEYGAILVTGDPEFRAVAEAGLISVDWIGSRS
jgi:predicted nucleic acid-binding protein